MANKYRYTFARKVTEENYLDDIIELPVNENKEIDYEYMENYMAQLNGDINSIPDYFCKRDMKKRVGIWIQLIKMILKTSMREKLVMTK